MSIFLLNEHLLPVASSEFPLDFNQDDVVFEAAKRLVGAEIELGIPLSKLQPNEVIQIIFGTIDTGLSSNGERFVKIKISELIKEATGSKRNPTLNDRALGLLSLEPQYK